MQGDEQQGVEEAEPVGFRLLWSARFVSLLGSWTLGVAVPAHVFLLTGSLLATGLTPAAEFVPPVLLGPIAGVLVDRGDRRRVMVAADVLRAVAVGLLLLGRDPGDLWPVYLALPAKSVGTVGFRPAAQAHVPAVVGPVRSPPVFPRPGEVSGCRGIG